MINVPDPFTLSVVYMTTDAMPSIRHLMVGDCGFVGRHVALLLARAGHQITLADRPLIYTLPPDVAEVPPDSYPVALTCC